MEVTHCFLTWLQKNTKRKLSGWELTSKARWNFCLPIVSLGAELNTAAFKPLSDNACACKISAVTHTLLSFIYLYASAVKRIKAGWWVGSWRAAGTRSATGWHEKQGPNLKVTRHDSAKLSALTVCRTKRSASHCLTPILLFLWCWGQLMQLGYYSKSGCSVKLFTTEHSYPYFGILNGHMTPFHRNLIC